MVNVMYGLATTKSERTLLKIAGATAVIAAVLSVVVPPQFNVNQGVRQKARQSSCLNNLKQLGMALRMYASENQDRYPVDGDPPTLAGSMKLLSNYIGTAKAVWCPSDWRLGARPASSLAEIT